MTKRAQFRLSYNVVEQGGVRGRPKEVATLKKLYHDCAQVSKVLIVEGKAGVGKTALITSQQTHFFHDSGHFVMGTFEQQRKSEPFSAIVDVLHELFEELLSEECSLDDNSAVKAIMEQFAKESKNDAGMKAVLQNAIPKFAELVQAKNDETRLQQEAFDMSGHSFGTTSNALKKTKRDRNLSANKQQPRTAAGGYKKRGWNFEKLKISLRLLLRCICSPKRRVVIFLDDLHYADPSSLELIEFLASGDGLSPVPNSDDAEDHDKVVQGLLLILAYRNVSSKPGSKEGAITIGHPFRTRLKELKQMKCPIHRIHVKDLDLDAVNEIVSTVTRHTNKPETTVPLSEVLYKKTGGNPFSVLHTLEYLEHEQLLYFSLSDYQWKWKNVRTIHSATDLSDSIVDMVAKKFQKLPQATQQILMLASCLGSYFRLEVIAAYFRKHNSDNSYHQQDFGAAVKESQELFRDKCNSDEKKDVIPDDDDDDQSVMTINGAVAKRSSLLDTMIKLLELPLQQDMLTKRRKSTTYFFAHERLQEVAYSLLPNDKNGKKTRKEIHWRLGKLMKEKSLQFPEEHWMAYLATDQLNRGLIVLENADEKVELASMNLQIALMSQEKSAFCPAAEFLRSAIRLLLDSDSNNNSNNNNNSSSKKPSGVEDPVPKQKANPSPAPTSLYSCSREHHKHVWGEHYDLCLDLFSSLAEMEYLLGNHKASKEAVEEVLNNARDEEAKFRAQVILIDSISAQRDFESAIETCLKILAVAHDMKLSANPMKLQIMNEKKKVNKMLEQQIQLDESRGSLDFNDSSASLGSWANSSFGSMPGSARSNTAVSSSVNSRPVPVQRVKSHIPESWSSSGHKPNAIGRVKSVGGKPNIPKNDSRFGANVPKNEGRFRKAVSSEASKITSFFHKKSEKAMMTLPKMTDEKNIRVSKLLSQLMLNAIISGKTDLAAYIGLRSIRFSFQHGISPHSPMALAAYGISQAKEGKYNEAYANGMLALKLLDVADSKEWYTRTILKCHNLRHIKKPFHESLDPMMEGYRTGVESGDMEYALVAAMHYSLIYMFVGLPVGPLEQDLMAFAEQVHRYHLPYVLEVTFYIYREFLLDLQGEEHDKILLDDYGSSSNIDPMDRSMESNVSTASVGPVEASNVDKRVRPLVQREMCVMNIQKYYIFGEFEEAEKMMNQLGELPKFDYSVLRTINRDAFFGLVNFALAKSTGKKRYRDRGQKIIEEFKTYVKNGSVNSHHMLTLLQAEDAALSSTGDWNAVTKGYDEAIRCAARAGFTNHEAIGNERAGRFLVGVKENNKRAKEDDAVADQAKAYISRAMALYREWGATAKVDQLEDQFPQLQPSKLMQGSNMKARRRFSRTLTARFRDMKLHSGRWSVGASSDLKILDGFDDLRGDQEKPDNDNGKAIDPYGFSR
ncbi:serine threonine protein kinase [Seminavis robusta]|uniref:Serine threonine protein kinase n=1 Tax=Seminavis robusta TaxID=568900 RepID=A0A9N8E8G2_9STRA|nr:serine threonine protein kinase [Seminavis robusta]|eukprot:Sro736_g195030.1 serine threonine protein kinase (1412) ;mRNA; r:37597-41832